MSIKFRTSTKSVVNYGQDLKSNGTCCFTNGTSQSLSFYECFIKNGTFILGENASCPDQGDIVTCYACAYLTTSQKQQVIDDPDILLINPTWGTKQVTTCECTRIGGNLSSIDPVNPTRDIRIPKACCSMDYNANGFPIGITCENVCSEKECSLKGVTFEGEDDDVLKHTPLYTSNKLCSQVNCNVDSLDSFKYASIATGDSDYAYFDIGTCYTLTKDTNGYSYSCDVKVLHECPDYWISSDYGTNGTIFCGNPYAPQVPIIEEGRVIEPEIMSESQFDSLNLQIGDSYKGGIYIGKFQPNSSNSKVYGSLNLSEPIERFYNDDTPRDEYTKWALIADFVEYDVKYMTDDEMNIEPPYTSLSDGFYNCYGNKRDYYGMSTRTINTIKGVIRHGFADYYIPSIIELYFLANAIRLKPSLKDELLIENTLTSSSIFFENLTSNRTNISKFKGKILNYAIDINNIESNFGKTYLIPANTSGNIRFFRKVILT